ncbi:NAD(P)-dependent oxidoreductase [SAR86 cluster bacterium]|nr:NAD(P)-dependent oxidoreductase [SAR86 cluster bacterium]
MKTILITGGAGLLGFNLCSILNSSEEFKIKVIDKNIENIDQFKKLFPNIKAIKADLSEGGGSWKAELADINFLIICHAQITSLYEKDFIKNNIEATENLLKEAKRYKIEKCIHISSSVIKSKADDFYTQTKKTQEKLVMDSGLNCITLRPTLMFGWFDRKHLGWLSRFMIKTPIFPIPGNGKYIRQPLYVKDFCNIIISALRNNYENKIYDISGLKKIFYIDIIKIIKEKTKSKSLILKVPYGFFFTLIKFYSFFDKNPPFTTKQLKALTIAETFKIIDWENIFSVKGTNFEDAIEETFNDKKYSNIILKR